jgi:hypothetical protein
LGVRGGGGLEAQEEIGEVDAGGAVCVGGEVGAGCFGDGNYGGLDRVGHFGRWGFSRFRM